MRNLQHRSPECPAVSIEGSEPLRCDRLRLSFAICPLKISKSRSINCTLRIVNIVTLTMTATFAPLCPCTCSTFFLPGVLASVLTRVPHTALFSNDPQPESPPTGSTMLHFCMLDAGEEKKIMETVLPRALSPTTHSAILSRYPHH